MLTAGLSGAEGDLGLKIRGGALLVPDGPGCPTDHGAVEHYQWGKNREFSQVTNVTAIRLSLEKRSVEL